MPACPAPAPLPAWIRSEVRLKSIDPHTPNHQATMLPAFGGSGALGSGNLLVDPELLGTAAPGAAGFLGSSAAGAGAAADPGFFLSTPESPAAAAQAAAGQPLSPGPRRGSGLGGGGAFALGASGGLAPASSRDLLRELECQEELFLPPGPTGPSPGAAPPSGVTVVPRAAHPGASPPTPPTAAGGLRWHEAFTSFPPLPPGALPPTSPLHTAPVAAGTPAYAPAVQPQPGYVPAVPPQPPPALFMAAPAPQPAPPLAPAG